MRLIAFLLLLAALLGGCQQGMLILEGTTHAKGTVHVEGYFTDSEGDIELCKVPDNYTALDAKAFCDPNS